MYSFMSYLSPIYHFSSSTITISLLSLLSTLPFLLILHHHVITLITLYLLLFSITTSFLFHLHHSLISLLSLFSPHPPSPCLFLYHPLFSPLPSSPLSTLLFSPLFNHHVIPLTTHLCWNETEAQQHDDRSQYFRWNRFRKNISISFKNNIKQVKKKLSMNTNMEEN